MNQKLTILAVALMLLAACNSKTKTTTNVVSSSVTTEKSTCSMPCAGTCSEKNVQVAESPQLVYFHNERRCATCMAVEDVAKESIAENGAIEFHSYQIGDEACEDLRQKLEVSGQALLLMGKDTTINLTNEAFMYARVEPEKYKAILEEAFKVVI